MKFCDACGAANEDSSAVCYDCGALLMDPAAGKKKKSSGIPKPVLAIGAVVLVIALIAGVVALVISLTGGEPDVVSAFGKSMDAFADSSNAEDSQIHGFVEQLNDYMEDGKYTLRLAYSGNGTALAMETDYDKNARQLQGVLDILDTQITYSVDGKVLQASIPGQFQNVYGVALSEVEELFNHSFVSAITKALKVNLDFDFFVGTDLKGYFEELAGDNYEELLASVEIEDLGEKELNGEICQVYEVTWSSEATTDLIASVGSLGVLPELGSLLNTLLPELEPECRCYVNDDGYLVAVDFVSAGAQCLFVLDGEDNIWDSFNLTVNSIYGESQYYSGALVQNGDEMYLYLKGESGVFASLEYNDATGDFLLYTQVAGYFLSGNVAVDGKDICLVLEWTVEGSGTQQVTWAMRKLDDEPEQLAAKYIDLLDMSLADWTRLLLDLGIQIPSVG